MRLEHNTKTIKIPGQDNEKYYLFIYLFTICFILFCGILRIKIKNK